MSHIIILCMGKKGYQSIIDIVEEFQSISISFIVAARDANIENDFYEEIRSISRKNNIPFYDRKEAWEKNFNNEYVFAISWRWMINHHAAMKLIIAHDSLLPKYRGFSPLANMLIDKKKEIGVTFLFADKSYDTGHIILQKKIAIEYPIKISEAISLISTLYSTGLIEIIRNLNEGKDIVSMPQNENEATYSLWRDEEDYRINFYDSSENIKRFIDSVGTPYKGASGYIGIQKIRILESEVYPDKRIENREAHLGKVIFLENNFPVVICQQGLLQINEIINDDTGKSILPLKNFRTRITTKK